MAYGCQDYQLDFPPVSFSTFKPLTQNKAEEPSLSTSNTTLRHAEETKAEAHTDKDNHGSSKSTPHKDILVKPGVKLKEQTYQWFERTQRKKLIKMGQFPEWFHGFLTRNRTEDLMQDKPQGCFLVRFCESRVGFVLSYRGVERCRHFVLNQRDDDQYVIEGEDIAHPQLEDLITYYCAHSIEPYKEVLTTPYSKNPRKPDSPSTLRSSPSSPPCGPMYGRITKPDRETPDVVPALATSPKDNTKQVSTGKFQAELQSCLQEWKLPTFPEEDHTTSQEDEEEPIVDYAPFSNVLVRHEKGKDEENTSMGPTYASVDELHAYPEPAQWGPPAGSNSDHEAIAFYAMGRGSCRGNLENVYSEVELNSTASGGSKAPKSIQSGFSTLPPATNTTSPVLKPSAFHSSFRSNKTSTFPQEYNPVVQAKPAKPASKPKTKQQIPLLFDDPSYGRSSFQPINPSHPPPALVEDENIYERILENYPIKGKNVRPPKKAS